MKKYIYKILAGDCRRQINTNLYFNFFCVGFLNDQQLRVTNFEVYNLYVFFL